MTVVVNQSDSGHQADYKPYLLMRGIIAPPFFGDPMGQIADLTATKPEIQISEWGTYNALNYKLLATPVDIPQFPEDKKMPMENTHARYVEVTLNEQNWLDM